MPIFASGRSPAEPILGAPIRRNTALILLLLREHFSAIAPGRRIGRDADEESAKLRHHRRGLSINSSHRHDNAHHHAYRRASAYFTSSHDAGMLIS